MDIETNVGGVAIEPTQLFASYQVSNVTRALFRCSWCGHSFDASATEFSRCPKCGSGMHANRKCEVCGIVFLDGTSGEGGRPAKVCSPRCRVRKHRVTKRGLYSANAPADLPAVAGKVGRDVGLFQDWIADKEAEYRMSGIGNKEAKEKAMEDWYLYEEPNARREAGAVATSLHADVGGVA